MTYAWASRGRLCPMRMVWLEHNYNDPKYELARLRKRGTRRYTMRLNGEPMVGDHWRHRHAAGRLGEWPLWRPDHRKRKRQAVKRTT